MSDLSARYFHDEAAAVAHLERFVWPNGPVCPHCGSISGRHYDLAKSRLGLRKCSDCRKQFTVKVGTVFECGHIPLKEMLQAVYLMASSKKWPAAGSANTISHYEAIIADLEQALADVEPRNDTRTPWKRTASSTSRWD